MNVIKTPTGLIPVDEPAKSMTQAEYNNLTSTEKNSGTYYIISGDGKSISLIIKDGVPLSSLPAESIKYSPPSGMTSNTIQDAITENHTEINNIKITINNLNGSNIKYTPQNGLKSKNVQDAISENANNINNMKPKTVEVMCSSSNWNNSSAPYTNVISVSGVTANNIVEVALDPTATDDEVKACMKASIAKITQHSGGIKLYAYGTKPTIGIPLICIVVNA